MSYVVHCKKYKPDNAGDYAYIGRPSKYGNPFSIGIDGTRGEVIAKYERWINLPEQAELRDDIRKNLRGKILGCWCSPKPCHGDVIERIANHEQELF